VKLLVLGGTVFLGRHLVEVAIAAGHEVTLFNRGQNNPDLFPEVEKLRGDRDGGLDPLRGRRWDAVVDTCGYVPRLVRASARLLSDTVDHYTFISSCSVYLERPVPRIDEDSPVHEAPPDGMEDVAEAYGPLKVGCELAAEAAMPGRVLSVRAGLIVGPFDSSNRFTYWVRRMAEGGEVLAPGRPERDVQVIDARDLATWVLRMAERRQAGVYNAVGPAERLTMRDLLDACNAPRARVTWVSEDFLLQRAVEPWTEMPLWLPDDPANMAFFKVDCRRALADGLTFRPLEQTARDTLRWELARSAPSKTAPSGLSVRAGMERERERRLLEAWRSRGGGTGT
jgi:2'-hydroxyisoflavone reductase